MGAAPADAATTAGDDGGATIPGKAAAEAAVVYAAIV